jgi:GT2 family glycosyltransferase
MELSIIIVNYKTPELTKRCIESILDTTQKEKPEILVVDNCSADNSEQLITSKFPKVIWINNKENSGFGRGNNMGAEQAKGDYLLFINSDIVVLENTITNCLNYIKANSDVGVLGCKLINEDGTFQKSIYHYAGDYMGVLKNNLIIDYVFKPKPGKIKAVMGAFMLIPKKKFDDVRGFDPDFFMYAEELDLCRRIEKEGFRIDYLDTAIAIHKHGGSSKSGDWAHKQNYLSNALLYLKVKGATGYFIYHLISLASFISNMLLLWKMDKIYRKDFWQDQKSYFSNFGNYVKIPFLYSKSPGNGKRLLKRA